MAESRSIVVMKGQAMLTALSLDSRPSHSRALERNAYGATAEKKKPFIKSSLTCKSIHVRIGGLI